MDCEKVNQIIWELDDRALGPEEKARARDHIRHCAYCSARMEEIHHIKEAFAAPAGPDDRLRARKILSKATDQARAGEAVPPVRGWRWPLAGAAAMAAAVVLAVLSLWPGETTAITIEKLSTQHRVCLLEGHHKNYKCDTQTAFAELTLKEMGLAPVPFIVPEGAFVKGDMCRIGDRMVAHAILSAGEKTVSFFRLADGGAALKEESGWTPGGKGVWWKKKSDALIVLRQFGDNDFGVYTGQVTLEELEPILESKGPAI